jgi:hypothetical protein
LRLTSIITRSFARFGKLRIATEIPLWCPALRVGDCLSAGTEIFRARAKGGPIGTALARIVTHAFVVFVHAASPFVAYVVVRSSVTVMLRQLSLS